jgi:hypothetical protein
VVNQEKYFFKCHKKSNHFLTNHKIFVDTVWAQRQLESRTTASASVWQLPGAVQTEMGKLSGSSAA